MQSSDLPAYVIDTNALYWYRQNVSRLGSAADAVLRLAAQGGARVIVPAIVVAELYYLTQKAGIPVTPSEVLAHIDQSREFVFSALGQAQLENMAAASAVPEMHDRLIAAEALVHGVPVISSDLALRTSGVVDVIW